MKKMEKRFSKEEIAARVEKLKEMFDPIINDESLNGRASGLAERWIYELLAGEEIVFKAAESLLNRSRIDYFSKAVNLMISNRLAGANDVLSSIAENDKAEPEKRIRAFEALCASGEEIKITLPLELLKTADFKKHLLLLGKEQSEEWIAGAKEYLRGLDDKQCYLTLQLLRDEVPAERLLEILRNLAGISQTADMNIVALLSKGLLPESVSLLQEIYRRTSLKEVQKEVNKALFKLKQAGVDVDTESLKTEKKAVIKPVESEGQGYISAPMAGHVQLLFFSFYVPLTGQYLFSAVRDFKNGLLDFNAYRTTKKGIKKYIEFLKKEKNTEMFGTSAGHCVYLIEEAAGISERAKRDVSGSYGKWGELMKKHIPVPESPEIYNFISREKAGNIAIDEAMRHSGEIDMSFLGLIEREDIASVYDHYRDEEEGKIIVSQPLKEEKVKTVLAEIADSIFDNSLRKTIKRKLEELSLILCLTKKEKEAENLLRLAIEADECSKPSESSFLIFLLENSLKRYDEYIKMKKKEEAVPSLIVPPDGEDQL